MIFTMQQMRLAASIVRLVRPLLQAKFDRSTERPVATLQQQGRSVAEQQLSMLCNSHGTCGAGSNAAMLLQLHMCLVVNFTRLSLARLTMVL